MVILHWILGWSKLPTRVKGVWLGWGQLCCVTVTEETLLFVLSGCCFGVWSPGSSACGLEFTLRETCLVLISDSFGSVHEYHETETGQRKFDNRKECATLVASWIKRFVNFCKNFRVWKKKKQQKVFLAGKTKILRNELHTLEWNNDSVAKTNEDWDIRKTERKCSSATCHEGKLSEKLRSAHKSCFACW